MMRYNRIDHMIGRYDFCKMYYFIICGISKEVIGIVVYQKDFQRGSAEVKRW